MEEASYRRHHRGGIMGGISEASERHLGGIWEASDTSARPQIAVLGDI